MDLATSTSHPAAYFSVIIVLSTTFFIISTEASLSNSSNYGDHHPCKRQCRSGEKPLVCEYMFEVEWYTTMSRACFSCPVKKEDCSRPECLPGSGSQRAVVTANRRLPGPPIEVCQGDRIRVQVHNGLQNGESTSIHWHGMRQLHSPYMDGVPMVTQCPIHPHTSFTYDFEAEAPGTYFWHSHSGVQRADGLAGALIIRSPSDPHAGLYDVDDVPPLIFNDWYPNETASFRFSTHHYGDADNKPPQILVNGLWQASANQTALEGSPLPPLPVPVSAAEYKLDPTLRYRFRSISNAFLLCPISITIDGHNLVVIATDGAPIKPQATRSLIIMPGERYDFVPYFTGEYSTQDAVYWLRATGLADCSNKKAQGLVRISYEHGSSPKVKSVSEATNGSNSSIADEVNSMNHKTGWESAVKEEKQRLNVVLLDSLDDDPKLARNPDVQVVVGMDFEPVNNTRLYPWTGVRGGKIYSPRLNHITNMMPPAPILSQPEDVPSGLLCNSTHRKCPPDEYCECIHAVNIPLNALVEVIIVDNGGVFPVATHPTHLHGYTFRLVGMDQVHSNLSTSELLQMDKSGGVRRKLTNAPKKDTITIPSGGYAIIRFIADNPGAWLFHCHMDFHMEIGMAMMFRVGPHTPPPLPSPSFPRCGSWSAPRIEPGQPSGTSESTRIASFVAKLLCFHAVLMAFSSNS